MGQLNFPSLSCMYNTNVHSIEDKNLVFALERKLEKNYLLLAMIGLHVNCKTP